MTQKVVVHNYQFTITASLITFRVYELIMFSPKTEKEEFEKQSRELDEYLKEKFRYELIVNLCLLLFILFFGGFFLATDMPWASSEWLILVLGGLSISLLCYYALFNLEPEMLGERKSISFCLSKIGDGIEERSLNGILKTLDMKIIFLK